MRPSLSVLLLCMLPGCEAVLGFGPTSDETRTAPSSAGEVEAGAGTDSADPTAGAGAEDRPPARGGAPASSKAGAGTGEAGTGEAGTGEAGTGEAPSIGGDESAGFAGEAGAPTDTVDLAWPPVSQDRTFRVEHPWPAHQSIGVCVQFESDAPKALLSQVWQHAQAIVEDAWLRVADVPLLFVGDCGAGYAAQIVVTVGLSVETQSGLGYPGLAERDIGLNALVSDAQVLYVFGRALGFEHEYGRAAYAGRCLSCTSNADCPATGRSSCLPSGFCENLADHGSIMGAPDCGGIESIRTFSRWDALGAQRAFGTRPGGSIVGRRARCLDLAGGMPTPGASIVRYRCSGSDNQRWERMPGTDSLRATIQHQDICAARGGDPAASDTSPLVASVCDSSSVAQQFHFSPVTIQTMGGLCIASRGATAGSPLWTLECGATSPSSLARWSLTQEGIQLFGSSLCVTVRDGSATLAATLDLEVCGGAPGRQEFSFADGEIRFVDDAGRLACFNVLGGVPQPGASIALWNGCGSGLENESFNLQGSVRSGNACIDSIDGLSEEETALGVATCTESRTQQWAFYW